MQCPPVRDKPGQPPRERTSERHGAPRGSSLIRPRTRVQTPLPRVGSAHAARRPREGRGRKERPKKAEKQPRARRGNRTERSSSAPNRRPHPQPPPVPPPRSHLLLLLPAPLAPRQTFSPLSPCFLAPRVTRAGADWRSRRRKAWRKGGGAGPAAN